MHQYIFFQHFIYTLYLEINEMAIVFPIMSRPVGRGLIGMRGMRWRIFVSDDSGAPPRVFVSDDSGAPRVFVSE